MTGEPTGEPRQFRYASRRIGLFVLLALAVFVAAILQAGVLRGLLNPTANLRVIMPAEGLAGLARGSAVEVLGTRAGEVREIVINPTENFHAIVRIDKAMQPFIRSDSKVLIRKQFGIAGAAFLDITRGTGAELDWDYRRAGSDARARRHRKYRADHRPVEHQDLPRHRQDRPRHDGAGEHRGGVGPGRGFGRPPAGR